MKATKDKEKKVKYIQRYTFKIIHYEDDTADIIRKNEGFSVVEMLGILEIVRSNLLKVFDKAVSKPQNVKIESTGSPLIHPKAK
jgi:hypothetical protein